MRTLTIAAALVVVAASPAAAFDQIPAESAGCVDNGIHAHATNAGVRIVDNPKAANVAYYKVDGKRTPYTVVGEAVCVAGYSADRVRLTAPASGKRVHVAEFDAAGVKVSSSWVRVKNGHWT